MADTTAPGSGSARSLKGKYAGPGPTSEELRLADRTREADTGGETP